MASASRSPKQVADADAAAANLVFVGRPDAARRGADLPLAAPRLRQDVELAVVRQDHVRLLADEQAAVDADAQARQLVHFLEQRLGIDHHAVADHARHAGVENARRDQVQHELLPVHVDGVPGVVPALIARHGREVRRQHVDDFSLAFVAPLRAEHCDIRLHHSVISYAKYEEIRVRDRRSVD